MQKNKFLYLTALFMFSATYGKKPDVSTEINTVDKKTKEFTVEQMTSLVSGITKNHQNGETEIKKAIVLEFIEDLKDDKDFQKQCKTALGEKEKNILEEVGEKYQPYIILSLLVIGIIALIKMLIKMFSSNSSGEQKVMPQQQQQQPRYILPYQSVGYERVD